MTVVPKYEIMNAPPSPRIFLLRHGETEWLLGGKHNSRIEVNMSAAGEEDVQLTRDMLVGIGKMINPRGVATMYDLSVLLAQSGMRVMCFPSRCMIKPTMLRSGLLLLVFPQAAVSTLDFRGLSLGECL